MATYIPNATNATQPTEDKTVESAALEFRTLKSSVNTRIDNLQTEVDIEEATRAAADTNLQNQITVIASLIEGGSVAAIVTAEEFTGDGVTVNYTLTVAIDTANHVDVYLDGVHQQPSSYTVAGTLLTFSQAPLDGVLICVKIGMPIGVGTTDSSLVQYVPSGTGAVSTTVQAKLRETVSVLDFIPVAEHAAIAAGTSTYDCASDIQNAINTGGVIRFPKGTYVIHSPLYTDGGVKLIGDGGYSEDTRILKTTTTVGTGSNTAPGGGTDTYNKNAIIILRHPNGGYNYATEIRGISLRSQGYIIEYGIYAPRAAHLLLEDVLIWQCKYGFVTHDTWLTTFTKVTVNGNSYEADLAATIGASPYGWTDSVGFWWDNGGGGATGPASGTTFNAEQTNARDVGTGWRIWGLTYSALTNCAADNISRQAYNFYGSTISMHGCGMENSIIGAGSQDGTLFRATFSRITLTSFQTYRIFGSATDPNSSMFRVSDSANVTMLTCRWGNFDTPGISHNFALQVSSTLVVDAGTLFPTNGNTYVSYSSGSRLIDLDNPLRLVNSSGTRFASGRTRDNQVLEKTSKAIAAGGTVIATFTSAGNLVDSGVCAFTVSWVDTLYPAGCGISKFLVAVQKETANYSQSISTVDTAYATTGGAGAPAYSLSRAGNVWSLTMTPQDGDCTAHTITAEMQNINGITLALP